MATLARIKDSLREHGYVETLEENMGPYVMWRRGERWVGIRETSPELFELHGPDVYHEARELCNCGKDYIFTSQGVKETEAEFFETIANLFQIRVCYALPSKPNNNGWRNFPLDTPHSEILAAIDAETPGSQTIGYYEGQTYVSLRKNEKKSCYEIEREIRAVIDPALFIENCGNYHNKYNAFPLIRIRKEDHHWSQCSSYTVPNSLHVSVGGLHWEFDFEKYVTIWHHSPYSRKSHAEGLADILATIEDEQRIMRK